MAKEKDQSTSAAATGDQFDAVVRRARSNLTPAQREARGQLQAVRDLMTAVENDEALVAAATERLASRRAALKAASEKLEKLLAALEE